MIEVWLFSFLVGVAMATGDENSNRTFTVYRLDSTVITYEYPWQPASECFYDQRLDTLTCEKNHPYENVTSLWKEAAEDILYVSVNCLTRGQYRKRSCVCKSSSSSSKSGSKPEPYTPCQLTRLDEGILRNLVNLEVLDLSFNQITTVSKRAFTALKKLKYLSLNNNRITDIPLGFLCQVTNLEYLGFSELALTSYPDQSFRCKSNFTSLKVMEIRGGKFTDIPDDALDNLPSLQSLDLSYTPITHVKKKAFSGSRLLEFLDLSNCNISSIFPFFCDYLPHISRLYLHDNTFTTFDFTTVEKCSSLTHLDLSLNAITTLRGNVTHLRALNTINLGFNKIESLNMIFNGLKNLTVLNFSHNNLKDLEIKNFAELSGLTTLNLSWNNISDSTNFSSAFHDLENLHSLDLSFNGIEKVSDSSFSALQNLKQLLLNHNSLDELGPLSFNGLNSLSHLSLDNNHLLTLPDDIFQPIVAGNEKILSHLSISYNNFSSFSNVVRWPVCEYLDISNNHLESVPSVIDYSKMRELNASHNEVVSFFGKTENLIGDFESMEAVDLSFNNIADIDFSKLQAMTNLLYMNAESNKMDFVLSSETFKNMGNLKTLNLADNNIRSVDNPFSDTSFQNLTLLNISNNPIQNLGNLSQHYNGSILETIGLSKCNITTIGEHTFRGLLNLKGVDLRENGIETFPPFSAGVSTKYNLLDNPIICSCTMSWLKESYVSKEIKVSNFNVPKCKVYTEDAVYIPRNLKRRQFLCPEVEDCDPQCSCFKTNQTGNVTIIKCRNNLYTLPKLSSKALSIFLDGNSFDKRTSLSALTNLTKMEAKELYLNKSNVLYLQADSFSSFDRLEILDLAFNLLTILPTGIFEYQTMLRQLYLNDNMLKTIEENVFNKLYSLQELDISGNNLVTLSSTTVTELTDLDYMKYFYLAHNNWTCGCTNIGLKDLVDDVLYKIRDRKLLVCDLGGTKKEIRYMQRSDFLCSGEDNSKESKQLLLILIIVIVCVLLLLLAVFVYFRREVLSVLYYITGCHIPGKTRYSGVQFDAYLTFDPADQHCSSYVQNVLMPKLKNNSFNIQTSSDVIQDLEVTRKVIEDSRCSIFIVDKNFATNSFLMDAFLIAAERQKVEKRHRVIVIIHGDIDLLTLEPELYKRMRKGDYITARSRLWWQRLIYELPEPTSGFRHGLNNEEEEEDVIVFSSLAEDQSRYQQF